MSDRPIRIGIDLGGTKIEGVALGLDRLELARHRVITPRHDYHATIEAVADLIARLEDAAGDQASIGTCSTPT